MNTTTTAVFTAAGQATAWTRTNLGPRTEISHAGYLWTVELPASGEGVAEISGKVGHGGWEFLQAAATPAQTIHIVEAAMAALRAPVGSGWKAIASDVVIGEYPTREAAQAQVEALIRAERKIPSPLAVRWYCPSCPEDEECEDCAKDDPRAFLAEWSFTDLWFPYGTEYSVEAV